MRVLVLGSGGREHALFWKIRQSPLVDEVYAAPGNGATQALSASITIDPTDPAEVLALVHERDIDLVVIGPDDAIAAGVADLLTKAGRLVFGPSAGAGRVESSKAFAKEVMEAVGVPTAAYAVFDDRDQAHAYAHSRKTGLVVKADGLALGKGVTVCDSVEDTIAAIDRAMEEEAFGSAGRRIILEERLSGHEVSLMCFCDGAVAVPMVPARDYKRALDGDHGPNTGGMGAYSPPSDVDAEMVERIVRDCAQPVVTELARRGLPYQGCLYTQVMLTSDGHEGDRIQCPLRRPGGPGGPAPADQRPGRAPGCVRQGRPGRRCHRVERARDGGSGPGQRRLPGLIRSRVRHQRPRTRSKRTWLSSTPAPSTPATATSLAAGASSLWSRAAEVSPRRRPGPTAMSAG